MSMSDIKEDINIVKELVKANRSFLTELDSLQCQAIENILNRLEQLEKEIEFLISEREYVKNNLEIDLNKRGIYSQAKGQISQILEHYQKNDEAIEFFRKKCE